MHDYPDVLLHIDGQWRTVDSKALFRAAVGMSELYNGLLADEQQYP